MVHQVDGARFRPSDLPPGRVAVMFAADWCGFSRRFYPHFRRLQEGWVVDISDEDDPLWDTLDIHVVPTALLFVDGVPSRRWAGILGPGAVDAVEAALSEGPASDGTRA